jgi:hypothetical protein
MRRHPTKSSSPNESDARHESLPRSSAAAAMPANSRPYPIPSLTTPPLAAPPDERTTLALPALSMVSTSRNSCSRAKVDESGRSRVQNTESAP